MLGCCLVSLHFRCQTHRPRPVQGSSLCYWQNYAQGCRKLWCERMLPCRNRYTHLYHNCRHRYRSVNRQTSTQHLKCRKTSTNLLTPTHGPCTFWRLALQITPSGSIQYRGYWYGIPLNDQILTQHHLHMLKRDNVCTTTPSLRHQECVISKDNAYKSLSLLVWIVLYGVRHYLTDRVPVSVKGEVSFKCSYSTGQNGSWRISTPAKPLPTDWHWHMDPVRFADFLGIEPGSDTLSYCNIIPLNTDTYVINLSFTLSYLLLLFIFLHLRQFLAELLVLLRRLTIGFLRVRSIGEIHADWKV